MPTSTSNFGLLRPLVNDATDQDLWGGQLNTDLDSIDSLALTLLNWTPSSKTVSFSVTARTAASTTTGSSKTLYVCDATSGAIVVTLPAASTASGLVVAFKKTDASANNVTITGNGAELIDAANTFALSARYSYAVLVCDGTGWNIIAQTPPAFVTAPGTMFNVQQGQLTTVFSTSASSYVALTGLAVTITPTLSTSTVLIRAVIQWGTPVAPIITYFRLMRGSTPIGVGTSVGSRQAVSAGGLSANVGGMTTSVIEWLDTPATTSATTYSIQGYGDGGNGLVINSSGTDSNTIEFPRAASSITVTEVHV